MSREYFVSQSLQICQVDCCMPTHLTREGKVLAPKKTRSRNVEQDIPQIREERPFVAFIVSPPVRVNSHHFWLYDILNQKGVSLAVNLSGIVIAGFLVLEQLLKFINDSLTLVEGNPDFSEIHFNDGVSLSLVVNGQTLLPGVAETRWLFKGHEHSQNGSDNVIIHFCRMCLLKHKITCCQ